MNKLHDTIPSRTSRNAGFTLLEILAVVVIMMVLAGTFFALAQHARRKARESAAQGEIANIVTSLEQYKLDKGNYPGNLGTLITEGYLKGWPINRINGNTLMSPFGTLYTYDSSANEVSNLVYTTQTIQNGVVRFP